MQEKLVKIFWLVCLLVLGGAGVLFILPTTGYRMFFLFILLFIIYWTVKSGSRIEVNTLALISAYLLSLAQFGLYFYLRLSAWFIVILTFVWVGLLFWIGFRLRMGPISASAKVLSLTTGLVGAEIVLALLFWPTHFLVTSTVFFLLFYLVWMTAHFYMSGILNWHRIFVHAAFVTVVLLVVLLTAQWTI